MRRKTHANELSISANKSTNDFCEVGEQEFDNNQFVKIDKNIYINVVCLERKY